MMTRAVSALFLALGVRGIYARQAFEEGNNIIDILLRQFGTHLIAQHQFDRLIQRGNIPAMEVRRRQCHIAQAGHLLP